MNLPLHNEEKQQEETLNTCSTLQLHRRFSCIQEYIQEFVQQATDLFQNPAIAKPYVMQKISKLIDLPQQWYELLDRSQYPKYSTYSNLENAGQKQCS